MRKYQTTSLPEYEVMVARIWSDGCPNIGRFKTFGLSSSPFVLYTQFHSFKFSQMFGHEQTFLFRRTCTNVLLILYQAQVWRLGRKMKISEIVCTKRMESCSTARSYKVANLFYSLNFHDVITFLLCVRYFSNLHWSASLIFLLSYKAIWYQGGLFTLHYITLHYITLHYISIYNALFPGGSKRVQNCCIWQVWLKIARNHSSNRTTITIIQRDEFSETF